MSSPDLFSVNDRCFVGKLRVMGIYQTGKRRFIRDNTEKTDELVLKREYDNKYDEFAVSKSLKTRRPRIILTEDMNVSPLYRISTNRARPLASSLTCFVYRIKKVCKD